MIENSNNESKFSHLLLLTDRQVPRFCKAFGNGLSVNIKLSKIVQVEVYLSNSKSLLDILVTSAEQAMKETKKMTLLSQRTSQIFLLIWELMHLVKIYKTGTSFFKGIGITLTNNEIKDIMKMTRSFQNRGILLKGTSENISSQEVRIRNFLSSLMTHGLSLMKNILTSLAKSVLVLLQLTSATLCLEWQH